MPRLPARRAPVPTSRARQPPPEPVAPTPQAATTPAATTSATQLASPSPLSVSLSDFEFTLITLMYGFTRWVETCMDAADIRGLSGLDILVLHTTNHRARDRRMSEICMVLNIDETHLVAYALKKLIAAGLVRVRTQGREHLYETTPAGDAACAAYRRVREEFLVSGLALTHGAEQLAQIERVMRTLLGQYDQAGRFATAASIARPRRPPPVRTKR